MALCAQAVTALSAESDPARLRRIAVRFDKPAFLGEELSVRMYDAGPNVVAFEADCADSPVITNGLAELRELDPSVAGTESGQLTEQTGKADA